MAKNIDLTSEQLSQIKTIINILKTELGFTNEQIANKMFTKFETIKNWIRETRPSCPPFTSIYRLATLDPKVLEIVKTNNLLGKYGTDEIYEEIKTFFHAKSIIDAPKSGAETIDEMVERYRTLSKNDEMSVIIFGLQNTLEGNTYITNKELGAEIKKRKDRYFYFFPDPIEMSIEGKKSSLYIKQKNKIEKLHGFNKEVDSNGLSEQIKQKCIIGSDADGPSFHINSYKINLTKFFNTWKEELEKKFDDDQSINDFHIKDLIDIETEDLNKAKLKLFHFMALERALVCFFNPDENSLFEIIPILPSKGVAISLDGTDISSIKKLFQLLWDSIKNKK